MKCDGRISTSPPVAGELSHCVRVRAGRCVSPFTIGCRRTSPRQSRQSRPGARFRIFALISFQARKKIFLAPDGKRPRVGVLIITLL